MIKDCRQDKYKIKDLTSTQKLLEAQLLEATAKIKSLDDDIESLRNENKYHTSVDNEKKLKEDLYEKDQKLERLQKEYEGLSSQNNEYVEVVEGLEREMRDKDIEIEGLKASTAAQLDEQQLKMDALENELNSKDEMLTKEKQQTLQQRDQITAEGIAEGNAATNAKIEDVYRFSKSRKCTARQTSGPRKESL